MSFVNVMQSFYHFSFVNHHPYILGVIFADLAISHSYGRFGIMQEGADIAT